MKPFQCIGKALLIVFVFSAPLFAEIYSWVDENGVRHFGNTSPTEQSNQVEVQDEIDYDKKNVATPKKDNSAWRERMEKRKAEEEAEKKKKEEKKLTEKHEKTAKTAYLSLKKIKDHLLGDIEWGVYQDLLTEAGAALARIEEKTEKTNLLTEAYKCYEIPVELRKFYNVDKIKSVNKILKKMNEEWGTGATNYFSGRAVCWARASEKLKEYDSY